MNKLAITAGAIIIALCGSQAQAGSPMMDDPLPLSVRGETSSDRFKAPTGNGHGQQAKPAYKSYRDRLGHGTATNSSSSEQPAWHLNPAAPWHWDD